MRRCAAANLRLRSLQCRRLSSRSSTSPAVVFLVAGEASGDVIGGRLMRSLRNEYRGAICFEGVGGDSMRAEGLSSLFPMSELSVAGFAEVLPSLPRIAARLVQTQRAVRRAQPHVVVGIDSKGFNLRLLRSLAHRRAAAGRNGIPAAPVLVQYVGPSAWAFGDADARAARLRGGVDELLVLLPLEEAAAAVARPAPQPGPPPRPRAPASTGALAAHGPAPCPTPRRSFGEPECPPPLSDTRRSTTWRSEASRRARRRSGRPRRRPSGAKSASRRARKSSACCLVAVRKR
mmetsp:Transcript_27837/g.88500  ORF Transcript_27837/g.88500 Transcript_27837/m.88500 type:complete len:290 (+) Transcript_27837:24-893(+)